MDTQTTQTTNGATAHPDGTTAATTPEKKAQRLLFLREAAKRKAETAPIPPATNGATAKANRQLADVAHKLRQVDKAKGRKAKAKAVEAVKQVSAKVNASLAGLPTLPKLPHGPRKVKAPKSCACGCAGQTRGGRFLPGHDARLHAWAIRVERGLLKASEVPAPHTEAVRLLLANPTPGLQGTAKAQGATVGGTKTKAAKRGVAR